MPKHFLLKPIMGLFLMISLSPAQTAEKTLVLSELIAEGLNNNPQLQAYQHEAGAESANVPQKGALPDPVLSFNLMNLPLDHFVFDQEPMSGKQIGLMQKFPFPGKLFLKEKIAKKNADISLSAYRELRNRLIRNVKTAYYDLYYIDQSIATTEKNRNLLKEFVEIARSKYAVGKGLQQDVLKAQVELSRLMDRLINLQRRRQRLEAQMNELLNRPADQPVGKTGVLKALVHKVDRKALESQIEKMRPLIAAWQSRLEQSTDKLALARKDYWPDFTLSLAYTQRDELKNGMSGVDYVSGGISLNVPLYFWRKQAKAVKENVLRKKQVEESFRNVRNQILTDLDNAITDLDKNAELMELYRTGIIPQAAQALESAMIGYQTDKVDFLTLTNNQMTLFNFELEYTRILSNYRKNLAELEFVTGIIIK